MSEIMVEPEVLAALRRLRSALIANAASLDVPFTTGEGSPWSNRIVPGLKNLREAVDEQLAEVAALRQQLDEARAERDAAVATARTVRLYGTAFIWRHHETGQEVRFHPSDMTVLMPADTPPTAAEVAADRDRLLVVYRAAEAWAGAVRLLVEIDGDHLSEPSRDLLAALDDYWTQASDGDTPGQLVPGEGERVLPVDGVGVPAEGGEPRA